MMQHLANVFCSIASGLLPPGRRSWGEAMLIELSHADDDRAALAFASGCLLTALRERIRDSDTRFAFGLWSIAVVTALFAILRIECAARGISAIFGARDGMHAALSGQGASLALIAKYELARPIVVGCFAVLGCAQLASAWFLSQRQLQRFLAAWSVALIVATTAVAIQLSIVWNPDGVPSELHALLVQAAAVPALLYWFHRRSNRMGHIS